MHLEEKTRGVFFCKYFIKGVYFNTHLWYTRNW